MKAIIVAGGKGERLRPLTDHIPKPMITVGDKPILEHTITLLKQNGIVDIVLALCYLPEKIEEYFGDGSEFGVNIEYIYEDPLKPRGTAGAILPAEDLVHGPFIVTYADILRELNVAQMITQHHASKSIAMLNVYQHRGPNFKSRITFGLDHRLAAFEELASSRTLEEGFEWSNASFYIFDPKIFDHIPKDTKSDFSKDVFPALLKAGENISVFPSAGYVIDIGTKESLEEARGRFANL